MKVLGLFIGAFSFVLSYCGTLGLFGYSKKASYLTIFLLIVGMSGCYVWMSVPF